MLLPRDKIYFSKELNTMWNNKKDNYDGFITKRKEIRETAMREFDENKILENLSKVVNRSENFIPLII